MSATTLAKEWADTIPDTEPPQPSEEQTWLDAIGAGVVTSTELRGMPLKPRLRLLGDWFCEGDQGYIFAFRGVGKTWFGLGIARALSEGSTFGPWTAHEKVKVLYVDGEMPADLIRARDNGLEQVAGEIEFLNHEILFERTGKVLNITRPEVQSAITSHCVASKVKVLVIDNLSTLASGMKENDADSWELVNNWLLGFRRLKIAVILIHHAGRNNEMRGTTKREDAAFWIIALDDAKKQADDKSGARFISRFTKASRNTPEEIPAYEWSIQTDTTSGKISVTHKPAQSLDVFRKLIEEGVTECTALAEELHVSKGTIAKWAKKAMDAGWLRKEGRGYALTESGE